MYLQLFTRCRLSPFPFHNQTQMFILAWFQKTIGNFPKFTIESNFLYFLIPLINCEYFPIELRNIVTLMQFYNNVYLNQKYNSSLLKF